MELKINLDHSHDGSKKTTGLKLTTNDLGHVAGGIDAANVLGMGRVGVVTEQQS